MKKLLFVFLSIIAVSCGTRKEIIDQPFEGVYIQYKETRYQVYKINQRILYIIKWDECRGKFIRQKINLSIESVKRK